MKNVKVKEYELNGILEFKITFKLNDLHYGFCWSYNDEQPVLTYVQNDQGIGLSPSENADPAAWTIAKQALGDFKRRQ